MNIEKYKASDYKLDELDLPIARKNFFNNQEQYNQKYQANYWCVFYAWWGALMDNLAEEKDNNYHLRRIKDKVKDEYGREEGKGMYLYKGVDAIRNYWNSICDKWEKISTFRIRLGSKQFQKALQKGYSIHTGFSYEGGGHSIRLTQKGDTMYKIDNYFKRENNIKEMEEIGDNYFTYGYIYVFQFDLQSQMKKDIEVIKKCTKKWITKNDKALENIKKGNYTQEIKTMLYIDRYNRLI